MNDPQTVAEANGTPPSAVAGPGSKRGRRSDMRTVHRVLSSLACLLMLYMGVTGTLIQTIDLSRLLTGTPEADATMQSINEGKFGGSNYTIASVADWTAHPLPTDLDVAAGIRATLAAFHSAQPDFRPLMVELRMVDGRVVGQVGFDDPAMPKPRRRERKPIMAVRAYDIATGASVSSADITPAMPPPSTRQSLKELHRFWKNADRPGVYIEFATGLVMSTLILTGLVMYFRLLRQRRRIGRPNPFWMAGERMRSLHRVVSVAAAVLLVLVAASGTWLGFESSWATFQYRGDAIRAGKSQHRDDRRRPMPLSDEQAVRLASGAYRLFRQQEPATPVRTIRARLFAGNEEAGVMTATTPMRQLIYNVPDGELMTLSDRRYPKSAFPLGTDVHEWVKHFHSGYLFGLPARFLDLLAGLSLIFLSVSGLLMYIEMYRRRLKSGRSSLFWK